MPLIKEATGAGLLVSQEHTPVDGVHARMLRLLGAQHGLGRVRALRRRQTRLFRRPRVFLLLLVDGFVVLGRACQLIAVHAGHNYIKQASHEVVIL